MNSKKHDVIIVGGGPCGLTLANELGRRGINTVLVDQRPGTAFNPRANATQARTMEHFRRLGFADEVRAAGLPATFPTDIAYYTRFAGYELARYRLPSAREASETAVNLEGSWSTPEPPHRCAQKYIEAIMHRHAGTHESVSLNYGWRATALKDHGGHVTAEVETTDGKEAITLTGSYLIGADGAQGLVRRHLDVRYTGAHGIQRDFFGGRMYAIYLKAPTFYRDMPHDPAWMNVCVNHDRRAILVAVDGKSEFAFHTQLQEHEDQETIDEAQARAMFQAAIGADIDIEILALDSWMAGHALVAEKFREGRIFLGGDAAHLFTPTGGLGYNTAVEDAVNLGWKLAHVINGQGGADLLDSYQAERLPLATRNTNYARNFADSLGLFKPGSEIEQPTTEGDEARAIASNHLNAHARAEFNIPGITFGGRYDQSPVIWPEATSAPPDDAKNYIPTAKPGGRPPHFWLPGNKSLFDEFGFEWTLLNLNGDGSKAAGMIAAAERAGLTLTTVNLANDNLRDLYECDFALIRPDQIVAWRGDDPGSNADTVLAHVTGRNP